MYGSKLKLYHSLSQICNWNCFYCDHPLIINPSHADIDYLRLLFPILQQVTKNYKIEHCVEGGEIGLIPEDILDLFFFESNFDNTYHVATNGKFLERNLHERYCDKIHSLLYHVKPDIKKFDFDFQDYNHFGIDFFYTIVIHRGNIDLISDFFDYHSDKKFAPHVLQPRREDLSLLDFELYKEIYDIVKEKDNVVSGFVKRYKYIIDKYHKVNYLESRRKLCCNNYKKMAIDYANKKLVRCCISMQSDSVDLNDDNLRNALDNDNAVFPSWESMCTDCIASFVFEDIYYAKTINKSQDFLKILKKVAR